LTSSMTTNTYLAPTSAMPQASVVWVGGLPSAETSADTLREITLSPLSLSALSLLCCCSALGRHPATSTRQKTMLRVREETVLRVREETVRVPGALLLDVHLSFSY